MARLWALLTARATIYGWPVKPGYRPEILAPLAYMGLIFYLSSVPGAAEQTDAVGAFFKWMAPPVQNLLHIPMFGLLAALWWRALARWVSSPAVNAVLTGLLAVGYAVADEWHQSFVPGRYSSATDLTLNAIGAAIAIGWCLRASTLEVPHPGR